MSLSGRAVLVTGGSGGIGRAVALRCAEEGAHVGVGFHASEPSAREIVAAITERGGRADAIALDVVDPASVANGVEAFVSRAGAVDALVCCAGLAITGLLATSAVEDLRRLVEANALGPILCAREVLPRMLTRRRGVLVFVGSVAATRPARGQAAYAATKSTSEALARAVAVEYGRKGIRALCVRPGAIDTAMLRPTLGLAEEEVLARIPARRVGTPAEVGDVIAFALGDRAAYMNGSVIDVDGGYSAS